MKTSDCKRADATAAPPDPRKHVNYIQGMVLGVDDLIQEFAYHQNQRQWLARDALGYGTLNGLRVTFRNDLKVSVAPGTALSPRGQLVRVTPEQCAGINEWLGLDKTKQELRNQGFALTGIEELDAYVVLCFRDCKVDELPVPGEPCRCEDQAMAPSRILDDFRLELRLSPPAQREEDAVRDFVRWLRQIKVSDAAVGGSSLNDFLDAIRNAAQDQLSPLESPPDFLYGSPPQNLTIPAEQLCEYLRAALKLWVIELRPLWQAQWAARVGGGCECHGDEKTAGQDAEECLLLTGLTITLTGGRVVNATDVVVDDGKRPFVVHLRMLQEMLLCGPCCGGGCNDRTFATVFALDDHTLRLWVHYPVPVTFDPSAAQLQVDEVPVSVLGVTGVMGGSLAANALNVFDLELGTSPLAPLAQSQRIQLALDLRLVTELVSPGRPLADALRESRECYVDMADNAALAYGVVELPGGGSAVAPGITVSSEIAYGQAPNTGGGAAYSREDHTHGTPPAVELQKDVIGNADVNTGIVQATTVALQSVQVGATAPTLNQVLQFDGTQWNPATLELPVTPAITVSPEIAYGQAPNTGGGAAYSREDHTHGTPPAVELQKDVIGNADVNTGIVQATTVALQSVLVNATAPTLNQVLQFDGTQWIPANVSTTGDFVEHPPGLPRFVIVAAGIVSGSVDAAGNFSGDDSRAPVYNDLQVIDISPGLLRITYKNYRVPNGQFQIVVKALPVAGDSPRLVLVNFSAFRINGIELRIGSVDNATLAAPEIAALEFMIEVSEFFRSTP